MTNTWTSAAEASVAMPGLDAWLAEQSLPADAEHPLWKPSGAGRHVEIRSVEHLTLLMAALQGSGFGIVEWPLTFRRPWAQTAPAGSGLIVELNDGVVPNGQTAPCTRRAFHGNPGEYPFPDETDPRYKTPRYPVKDIETFTALQGAEVIWTWLHTRGLAPGVSLTMRHFGERERRSFGCGDL